MLAGKNRTRKMAIMFDLTFSKTKKKKENKQKKENNAKNSTDLWHNCPFSENFPFTSALTKQLRSKVSEQYHVVIHGENASAV